MVGDNSGHRERDRGCTGGGGGGGGGGEFETPKNPNSWMKGKMIISVE